MRFLIFTALFALPFVASAASFELDAAAIGTGESTQVTLSVSSVSEAVYTAEAKLLYDQNVLSVSDIRVVDGWIALTQPEHNSISEGRFVKTGGLPGGTTSAPFLTFTVTKLTDGLGVVAVESTSKIYNKESVNVASEFDTQIFAAASVPVSTLPAGFTISETTSAPIEVEIVPIIEEEQAPIEEVSEKIALPAAVITFEGNIPYIPFLVVLLILLAVAAVYFIIRSGRKDA